MEPSQKSQETTKSTQFSILSIPNVELAIRQLHIGELPKHQLTQYAIENGSFSTETLCFGDIFVKREYQNSKAEYFTWRIRTKEWFKTPETAAIFNEYLDWIKQHKTWVNGIKFEFKDNLLYVTFPFKIPKLQFHYLVFLLRRLEWHPYTVVSWYILNHLNLKFTEQQKLQLANFIVFEEYKNKNTGYTYYNFIMGHPDSSHYLCSALVSTGLYTTDIPDPGPLFDPTKLYGHCQTYASTLWFGPKTIPNIENKQIYSKLASESERMYEKLSSNW